MTLRQRWERFSQAPVGRRFQERYYSSHDDELQWFKKPLNLIVGSLILLAGLLMLVAPGPGFLAVFLGAALLAQESLWMARALDATDKYCRLGWNRTRSLWSQSSTRKKAVLILVGLLILATLLGLGGWAALQWLQDQNTLPGEL